MLTCLALIYSPHSLTHTVCVSFTPHPCCVQNEVESIRLRTAEYEMIIAQVGHFTIIVSQSPAELLKGKDDDEAGEKKDGVAETKKD